MKTTLHSDIGEFITQLSNQDAPFLKANAYVRFGDLIVAVRDACLRARILSQENRTRRQKH